MFDSAMENITPVYIITFIPAALQNYRYNVHMVKMVLREILQNETPLHIDREL